MVPAAGRGVVRLLEPEPVDRRGARRRALVFVEDPLGSAVLASADDEAVELAVGDGRVDLPVERRPVEAAPAEVDVLPVEADEDTGDPRLLPRGRQRRVREAPAAEMLVAHRRAGGIVRAAAHAAGVARRAPRLLD